MLSFPLPFSWLCFPWPFSRLSLPWPFSRPPLPWPFCRPPLPWPVSRPSLPFPCSKFSLPWPFSRLAFPWPFSRPPWPWLAFSLFQGTLALSFSYAFLALLPLAFFQALLALAFFQASFLMAFYLLAFFQATFASSIQKGCGHVEKGPESVHTLSLSPFMGFSSGGHWVHFQSLSPCFLADFSMVICQVGASQVLGPGCFPPHSTSCFHNSDVAPVDREGLGPAHHLLSPFMASIGQEVNLPAFPHQVLKGCDVSRGAHNLGPCDLAGTHCANPVLAYSGLVPGLPYPSGLVPGPPCPFDLSAEVLGLVPGPLCPSGLVPGLLALLMQRFLALFQAPLALLALFQASFPLFPHCFIASLQQKKQKLLCL